jgi:hypothetical protein
MIRKPIAMRSRRLETSAVRSSVRQVEEGTDVLEVEQKANVLVSLVRPEVIRTK